MVPLASKREPKQTSNESPFRCGGSDSRRTIAVERFRSETHPKSQSFRRGAARIAEFDLPGSAARSIGSGGGHDRHISCIFMPRVDGNGSNGPTRLRSAAPSTSFRARFSPEL
ncbi:hypothetical protein CDO73_21150 [Saccharibacillus sp. O23]|nr:hypothetical protein CDO73_21150 [Saccharibacillus sp. O23]